MTALGGYPTPGAHGLQGAPPFLSESFTPDHKPLMGEAPELRGFFLGCGFNSAGACRRQPPGTLRPLLQLPELPRGAGGAGPCRVGSRAARREREVPLEDRQHPTRCQAAAGGEVGSMLPLEPGGALGVHCRPVTPLLSGMMLGGGCGKELAHWIVHGRPEKDMYGYDIR